MTRTKQENAPRGKRICLYFGSFNPVHRGHMALVHYALRQEDIDEVWMVLSPQNPQKDALGQLPYQLRRELIRSSIEDLKGVRLEEIETMLPKPHYTIRSIQALRCLYPQCAFSLLVGEDNLCSFVSWHDYKRILEGVRLFVYPRTPRLDEVKREEDKTATIVYSYWADAPSVDISSTQIREALKSGVRLEGVLPREVQWEWLERWCAEI